MNIHYYQILGISYGLALMLWWGYSIILINNNQSIPSIRKPWLKAGIVVGCGVLTISFGQLYVNNFLIPDYRIGSFQLGECINQIIIYSPFLLYFPITGERLDTAWLPAKVWKSQIVVGMIIACIALIAFCLMAKSQPLDRVFRNVFHIQNAHHSIQIFLEDLAISMFLARLSVGMGKKFTILSILIVSFLFALGHFPANLESGKPIIEIGTSLLMDWALVFLVCLTLIRFRSFIWFFPIHFTMDMMQFYSGIKP